MARYANGLKMSECEKLIAAKLGVSTRTVRRYRRVDLRAKLPTNEQLKPWAADGISRRTWYRRRHQKAK